MEDMATITIDGKTISVRSGENLLEMAHQNNIPIPSLCYHRKLTPTGACRLCITKIKGMNGLVAACTVTVSNGMEVTAFDEELEDTRRYLRRTFNCGVGMVVVVNPAQAPDAIDILKINGEHAWQLGTVIPGNQEVQYV